MTEMPFIVENGLLEARFEHVLAFATEMLKMSPQKSNLSIFWRRAQKYQKMNPCKPNLSIFPVRPLGQGSLLVPSQGGFGGTVAVPLKGSADYVSQKCIQTAYTPQKHTIFRYV